MINRFRIGFYLSLIACTIALTLTTSVLAEIDKAEAADTVITAEDHYFLAAGIGIMTIIGQDMRMLIRKTRSPWVFGAHYFDVEDDFINEALVALPNDSSDKLFTRRIGLEVDYLISPVHNHSFYVGGGLFKTTKSLKCDTEIDSASSTGLFFGGGLQGQWSRIFGYQLGILLSPTNVPTLKTSKCEISEGGDFDINISLFLGF